MALASGFQFEFDKGEFPFRFCLLGYTVTAIALLFSHGAKWRTSLSAAEVLTLFLFVSIFFVLCLVLLWMLRKPIRRIHQTKALILGWLAVVTMAAAVCMVFIYLDTLENYELGLLNTQYLTPVVGYSTLGFCVLLIPPLLLFEKKIFSDKAALLALQSAQYSHLGFQIRPHFLFNSLNSVAGLIIQNPTQAETALYNLADVFRAVLANKRQLVPLKAELDLADKYIFLEKIRLGNRLKVISDIDPNAIGVKVPIFLLQPLLENAVYHGIEARLKGGIISLNVQQKKNNLIVEITNPLPDTSVKRKTGIKVAQQNLRQRVITLFGNAATLDSYETETSFHVIVQLPL